MKKIKATLVLTLDGDPSQEVLDRFRDILTGQALITNEVGIPDSIEASFEDWLQEHADKNVPDKIFVAWYDRGWGFTAKFEDVVILPGEAKKTNHIMSRVR